VTSSANNPLIKVLWLVDGGELAMDHIYEAMYHEKDQINTSYKDIIAKYGPIWEIIDNIWNN
jgi:hypothetical protein